MMRLAVCGMSHDHVWPLIHEFLATEKVKLVGGYAENDRLWGRFAREFGLAQRFASPEQALTKRSLIDVALICGSNRQSVEWARQAVENQIHVMLEKPGGHNLSACRELIRAKPDHVQAFVNWPDWLLPSFRHAQALVDEGALGELVGATCSMGHMGPKEIGCSQEFVSWLYDPEENGPGGAIVDYGCYGIAGSLHFFGLPKAVSAVRGNYTKQDPILDDFASIQLIYDRAQVSLHAAWNHVPAHRHWTLYGSDGTLEITREQLAIQTVDSEKLVLRPEGEATAAAVFLEHIESGLPVEGMFGLEANVKMHQVLELAIASADEGRTLSLSP